MPRYNHHNRHNRHNRHNHRDYAPAQWRDPMTSYLIELRRDRNEQYHITYGRSRQEFWSTISRRFVCMIFYKKKIKKIQIQIIHLCEFRINDRYNTNFTGLQCSQKFRNLVRDYRVSKKK
jgi:hypothetical protein